MKKEMKYDANDADEANVCNGVKALLFLILLLMGGELKSRFRIAHLEENFFKVFLF